MAVICETIWKTCGCVMYWCN